MKIHIRITTDPLEKHSELLAATPEGCGALVEFQGVVRGEESGRKIDGLVYEAYEPMARHQMELILHALEKTAPCREVRVLHRFGNIPVGQAAIIIQVAAAHRTEAFTLVTGFMDRLKQDVPIWKTGVLGGALQ